MLFQLDDDTIKVPQLGQIEVVQWSDGQEYPTRVHNRRPKSDEIENFEDTTSRENAL